MTRVPLVVTLLMLAVAGCGSNPSTAPSAAPGSASATAPGGSSSAAPAASPLAASPTATSPSHGGSPTPIASGNRLEIAVPSDEPKSVASLAPVPSCGSIVSFEVDPDVSPPPTPPATLTSAASNEAAMQCFISAWQGHRAASVVTDETTDEQDRIYTLYRLPGDGKVDVVVRLDSHTEKTVTWTRTSCRNVALADGRINPSDCESEQVIR